MTFNKYQQLAARTINTSLTRSEQCAHALYGMVGEIGELHSIYQKQYQGHGFSEEHAMKEVGDILWMIAEYCTVHDWKLDDIAQLNIDKLQARYPGGFDIEHSINRDEKDI